MENEVVIIPTVHSRAQRLLASYVPKMSASMQLAYKEGRLKFTDGYYFKRFALPAGANGLQDILLNDDSQKDGYCTISKQKIDQGCAFMANRFTFKVYTVATASLPSGADEGNCTYGTVAAATAVPVVQCAELEMTVNGTRQWKFAVSEFNHEATDANSEKDGINVEAPIFINDEQLLQFRLHLPQGKSVASTQTVYVEVAFRGAQCSIVG